MNSNIHFIIGLKAGEPLDILENNEKVDVKTAHKIVNDDNFLYDYGYQWWMEAGLSEKINNRSMTKQQYKKAYNYHRNLYWQIEQDQQWAQHSHWLQHMQEI